MGNFMKIVILVFASVSCLLIQILFFDNVKLWFQQHQFIDMYIYIYHCHLDTVYLYANKVPNDYKEYLYVYFSQLILNNIALLLFSGMLLPFVNSRKPFMRVFCLIDCRAVTLHFFWFEIVHFYWYQIRLILYI